MRGSEYRQENGGIKYKTPALKSPTTQQHESFQDQSLDIIYSKPKKTPLQNEQVLNLINERNLKLRLFTVHIIKNQRPV